MRGTHPDFCKSHFLVELGQVSFQVFEISIWIDDDPFYLVKFKKVFPVQSFVSENFSDRKEFCRKIFFLEMGDSLC